MNTLYDVVIQQQWVDGKLKYRWDIYRPGDEQRGARSLYYNESFWMWSAKFWIKRWYNTEMRYYRKIEKRRAKREAHGDLKVYRFRLGK